MIQKDTIKDIGMIICGNVILAIGISFFILPLNILSGGVAGVSVALEPFLHIPAKMMIPILTYTLFIIGAFTLGKKFALNTVISSILYPILVNFFTSTFPIQITTNPMLSSIYAGIFLGAGVGLVYRAGASTGGMDIPPLIINKYFHIPLPTLVLIIDGLTVCLGIAGYGLEAAMIGLLSVFVCSTVINKVLTFGGHAAKNVMIISKKYKEIEHSIYKDVNRGATIISAVGGYTKEERPMIMVVVTKKQLPLLQKHILQIDPEAFVIVTDTKEVQGLGFTYQEEL